MPSKRRKTGDIGEEIALKFLMKHGFKLIERNYLRKCGEIDLIVQKAKIIHFIEVKSKIAPAHVTHETPYNVAENISMAKLQKMKRTIALYLLERRIPETVEYRCDALIVEINMKNRLGRVRFIKDIL
jgi:putative endonuclease